MAGRDTSELARVLPRLRHDFETSRRLVTRAVERASRLADEAIATRRLLEARVQTPHTGAAPNAEIWNAAARELVRVSRERDRELGVVAHELRQSLSAALAADRLLAVSTNPAALDRAHAILSRQLLHLSQLVDTLLDYSRLSLQASAVPPRRVDLVDLVGGAVETVSAAAAERRQRIEMRHDGAAVVVSGDPVRLRQAVVNLLQNSVRYTPDEGRIDIAVFSDAGHAYVEIRDTGEGIDGSRLKAIFDPFVRVSAAGPGLGIGLSLVKRIAELHGGTVVAASDGPSRGSTFTLSLPVAAGQDGGPS